MYWFDKHGIESRDVPEPKDEKKYRNEENNTQFNDYKQTIFCHTCGELVPVTDYELGDRRYCSRECYDDGRDMNPRNRVWRVCEECGSRFKTAASQNKKFCSHECYSEHIYEGNQTLNRIFRKREVQKGWRERVFERDNYTCQDCGVRGKELQAHHKVPVSEIIREIDSKEDIPSHTLFNDVSNGVTLCKSCHEDRHE